MPKPLPFLVAAAFLLATARSAQSQWWGGCRDVLGRPVLDYPDNNLRDIAMASMSGGTPVIYYNPMVVMSVSPATRRFFYYHECGHHALGQIVSGQSIPYVSEQEADCWAARTLVQSHIFSLDDLREVQQDVSRSPGDWAHLPGPQRALNLIACLGDVGGGGGGGCHTVTEYETQTAYVTQYAQQSVPCTHWGCGYAGCGFLHPYDVVTVPQQVPVTRQVPVQRMRCN